MDDSRHTSDCQADIVGVIVPHCGTVALTAQTAVAAISRGARAPGSAGQFSEGTREARDNQHVASVTRQVI